MKRTVFLVSAIFLLFAPIQGEAASHCVRQGAIGANTGVDWHNAYVSLPSTLTRGDTYYVAAGTYPGYIFDDPAAGSTYITVKKATPTEHGTDSGWDSLYGEGVAHFTGGWVVRTNYWIIDGVTGSGDKGHGFKVTTTGLKVVDLSRTSHVSISHADLDHQGRADAANLDIVYINSSSNPSTDITISYCYLHECGRCPFLFREVNNSTIEHCLVYRNKLYVTDHSEGLSAFPAYQNMHSNTLRYNVFKDIGGTGQILFAGDNWRFYGNLFFWTGAGYGNNTDCTIGNMSGQPQDTYGSSNTQVYNNTFVGITGTGTIDTEIYFFPGETGNIVRNNLWVNCLRARVTNASVQSNNITNGTASIFNDPSNYDFSLKEHTAPGYPLEAQYGVDMLGHRRGLDGTWDIGAYEFNPPDIVIAPPHGLKVMTP